jgi:hypothetical protein
VSAPGTPVKPCRLNGVGADAPVIDFERDVFVARRPELSPAVARRRALV